MCLLLIALLSGFAGGGVQQEVGNEPRLAQLGPSGFRDEVSFHLYHGTDPITNSELFEDDLQALNSTSFNRKKPTKFIIHSWTDSKDVSWIQEMATVMHSTARWNVLVVDWAPLSHAVYTDAFEHTILVAKRLADFASSLVASGRASFRSIHFVGHGLGAIVAGRAARMISQSTGKLIARITGLDPAMAPLHSRSTKTMSRSDAKFVDVVHTNGGGLGVMRPLGEVDFYPNGGRRQPGCGSSMCNHVRACEYFTASIKDPFVFKAYSEELWRGHRTSPRHLDNYPMGMAANPTMPPGVYYVVTTDEPPFVHVRHKFIRK